MPHGPYPNHRTPPPHIYQHQSSILDCDQLAGHCQALTQITSIPCQSEDSCVYKRGTSVLCGPTEVSQRWTISHAVAPIRRHIPPSIWGQSSVNPANPLPIRCQSIVCLMPTQCWSLDNLILIQGKSDVNPKPTTCQALPPGHQSNVNPVPI